MNITHIKDSSIDVPENLIEGIFARQMELHMKYKEIEHKSGIGLAIVQGRPFSTDDPRWQYVIKDFAWRVTEEMAEAMEAHLLAHHLHETEELIDALHFYTELLIIVGIDSDLIEGVLKRTHTYNFWSPVYMLGIACNFLKQKPWKSTHVVADSKRFRKKLVQGYIALINVILDRETIGDMHNLYMVYYKKSLVNQFRQDSNY